MGECVTDTSIIKYLKDKRQIVGKELSCGGMLKKVKQRGDDEKKGQRVLEDKQVRRGTGAKKCEGEKRG